MLTILTGAPGSGKTYALLEIIRARALAGQKSLLLVPESVSHQFERRLLEHCGNPAGRFATVSTFSKLTEDLLEEAGLAPLTLDAGGQMLMMYRAMEESASALTYYKQARRPQLLGRLLDTVQELKACAILPEQLLTAAGETPGKLRDLAVLYAAYCNLCSAGGMDPADRTAIAAACVPASKLLQDTAVFLDDFDGFTGNKYPLLKALLQHSTGMTVSLLWEKDLQLYKEQHRTLGKLRQMANDAGKAVTEQNCTGADAAARPRAALARRIYQYGAKPVPTEQLMLYSAKNPEAECELVAGLVRQKALSGTRLYEMAVVCGDLAEYSDLLEQSFARYEIPLFLSEKHDVLQTPAVIAALGALQALEDGLRPESLFDWLRSLPGEDHRKELDELENYALLWNIRGEQWLRPFTKATCGYDSPDEEEPRRLAGVEQTRQAIASLLLPLREALSAAETGGAYAAALETHLQRMQFAPRLEQTVTRLAAEGREQLANEYQQLYRILTESLQQFTAALGDRPMARNEFLPLLRLLLSQYQLASIPASLDSVSALTFPRISPYRIRHLFVLGGREGLLPPGLPSGGLLTEQERLQLELQGIELTQSQEGRAFQQQSYLCRTLACPTESLTMTRPLLDSEGNDCRPSHVWKRLELLSGSPERPAEPLLKRLRLTAYAPAYEQACAALEQPSGFGGAALEYYKNAGKAETFTRMQAYGAAPRGPIRDGAVRDALYGKVLRMTASRLERVSSCRFSYFAEYGLKAKARKPAEFGALQVGSFVHDVLENALRDLCRDPNADPAALVEKYTSHYLQETLAGQADSARLRATCGRISRNILEILRNVWDEVCASDFKPACFELNFRKDADLPPVEMKIDDVTLQLGGKIDRVDAFRQEDKLYLKVIDYKTGTKEFRLSDLLYGRNLQMFLYLYMLKESNPALLQKKLAVAAGEATQVVPAAALYIPTKDPVLTVKREDTPQKMQEARDKELRRIGILRGDQGLPEALEHSKNGEYRFLPVIPLEGGGFDARSSVANEVQMNHLLRQTEQVVRDIGSLLARGDIEATPYREKDGFNACKWCEYRAACHFDTGLKKDRYREDPFLNPVQVYEVLQEKYKETVESKEDSGQKGGEDNG